jgi:hypothetical protein
VAYRLMDSSTERKVNARQSLAAAMDGVSGMRRFRQCAEMERRAECL